MTNLAETPNPEPGVGGPFFTFELQHRPAPQGSYKPIALKNQAGQYTGKTAFKASSAGLKAYRSSMAWVVRGGCRGLILDEPVAVVARWVFPRPKRPKATCADESGRMWPATRSTGDVDKLTRAVLDALHIGGAIEDDSQVVGVDALMSYAEPRPDWEGSTHLEVWAIDDYMRRN